MSPAASGEVAMATLKNPFPLLHLHNPKYRYSYPHMNMGELCESESGKSGHKREGEGVWTGESERGKVRGKERGVLPVFHLLSMFKILESKGNM